MRKFIYIMNLISVICCNSPTDEALKKFIPGTYIRLSRHEFGTEHDTLTISIQNESASVYRIIRKWKYERVLDNQRIPPEYQIQISTGEYDVQDSKLKEGQTGRTYSFDPEKNVLYAGSISYEKLK